jgi:hypothetical protein
MEAPTDQVGVSDSPASRNGIAGGITCNATARAAWAAVSNPRRFRLHDPA